MSELACWEEDDELDLEALYRTTEKEINDLITLAQKLMIDDLTLDEWGMPCL